MSQGTQDTLLGLSSPERVDIDHDRVLNTTTRLGLFADRNPRIQCEIHTFSTIQVEIVSRVITKRKGDHPFARLLYTSVDRDTVFFEHTRRDDERLVSEEFVAMLVLYIKHVYVRQGQWVWRIKIPWDLLCMKVSNFFLYIGAMVYHCLGAPK